jgi:WD40 repeat protein
VAASLTRARGGGGGGGADPQGSRVKIWHLGQGRFVHILAQIGRVTALRFSPDGRFLCSAHCGEGELFARAGVSPGGGGIWVMRR